MTAEDRAARLRVLEKEASACVSCRLNETRSTVVFGDGDANADLMFIGEGPGQHEDEQGLPFVGRSGQLLSTLLERVGLSRDLVSSARRRPRHRGRRARRRRPVAVLDGHSRRR